MAFNDDLAKKLKSLKKDLGAVNIRQGYRGTGTRSDRRQIFVTFANDKSIDIWLCLNSQIDLGGVTRHGYGSIDATNKTVDQAYDEIREALRPLTV